MRAVEYRALAKAPWWKVWLHRSRSQAINRLLDSYLKVKGELAHERWMRGLDQGTSTEVINFLANRIK